MSDSLSTTAFEAPQSGDALHSSPSDGTLQVATHPSAEVWIDYFNGDLSGEEANGLSRHLSHCRQCIDLILDLDAFAEPVQEAEVADFEKAAVWRTVTHAMEVRNNPRSQRWPAWAAMAASLCLGVFGLSAWSVQQGELKQLRTQAATVAQAPANAVIANLRPGTRQRSSGSSVASLVVGEEPKMLVFILNLIDPVDYPGYEVKIFDSNESEVARIRDLKLTDIGNFQLALLPGVLDTGGKYDLRLFGLENDSERLLETFPIRLKDRI